MDRFAFKGLHKPAIVEVYFPPEATSLIVRFDVQPTNRAGMNGVDDCSMVLADATVAMGHIATHGPGLLADLFHDGHCCNETTSEESPCRRGT